MKTLHRTLGIMVLLGTVSLSAYAQVQDVVEVASETKGAIEGFQAAASAQTSAAIDNSLRNGVIAAERASYREVFPEINVGIRDNEELTIAPLNFRPGVSGANGVVRDLHPMEKYISAVSGKTGAIGVGASSFEPVFVPFEPSQKVSRVGMKEFFSAVPSQSPRWVGLFGLSQCVGVAIVSKQGTRVLRVSVAHIDSKTQIGEGQSENFFKQAVDTHATTIDVYFLADNHVSSETVHADNYSNPERSGTDANSPEKIVWQIKERLAPFANRNVRYHEQLSGVPQFAVNTSTGRVSTEVSFPRDLIWTSENELHFNMEMSNILTPAQLSPSPAMEAVLLRQRYPQAVSGPVRETFPEEGMEIVNDADLTLRPIGEAAHTPVAAPQTQAPWRVGAGFEKIPNAPIREYFPGMGYILDDADGTFVPER